MQLEEYFEFEKLDTKFGPVESIRLKGHRIAIEDVLQFYRQGNSAEQIQQGIYPTLTLDEVHATISYYLQNKEAVEAYIAESERIAEAWYQEYLTYGPFFLRDRASQYALPPQSDRPAHA